MFSPEEVAPYSVDPPSVLIPFEELKNIAAHDGALTLLMQRESL